MTLPKPYYEHAGITIYHGDCREILPSLDVGVVVTDPPYGVAMLRGDSKIKVRVTGDDVPFDPSHLTGYPAVIWGGNGFASRLPDAHGWLVWDKTHPDTSRHSQAEIAWTNCVRTVRIHREAYHGFMRARDGWFHPTQKPVGLFKWILGLRGIPDGTVVDPYTGSGPCLIAAKDLGRRAIGIEIEERYCEIAAKRLAQEVLFTEGASR